MRALVLVILVWAGGCVHCPVTFIALGDSLTSGYGNPGPAWPAILADETGWTLLSNEGVPGDLTADMLGRLGPILDAKPDLLLVMGGINDVAHCVPQADTLASLDAIATAAMSSGIAVAVLAPPHDGMRTTLCGTDWHAAVDALDDAIMAAGYRAIDLRPAVPASATVDNVHPDATGAKAIADAVAACLA
jgi:acyl-CoA thioesterase I